MTENFPAWKYALLVIVLLVSVVYALPNIYGEDPAVQIIGLKGAPVDEAVAKQVTDVLTENNLEYGKVTLEEQELLVRFKRPATQLVARDVVQQALDGASDTPSYSVALNLAPATPNWLTAIGAKPMKLGLDLRGGVRFVLEVDVEQNIKRRAEGSYNAVRSGFRQEKIRYTRFALNSSSSMLAEFASKEELQRAISYLNKDHQDLVDRPVAGNTLAVEISLLPAEVDKLRNTTMEQTAATLRNRVNELGVAEAVIQREGNNKVVVELPGVQDTARAKDILGKTATLDFLLEDSEGDLGQALAGKVPPGSKVYEYNGVPILLKKRVILSGDSIIAATSQYSSQNNLPVVSITLSGKDTGLFSDVTAKNIGKRMAVIYHEQQRQGDETINVEKVISYATINDALGNKFEISGLALQEARDLALLLRSGSMPAAVSIVEERVIGPSMGQENIDKGIQSVVVGFCLIIVFMTLYYSAFGVIANIALFFNLIFLVALMSILGATLTLPGIAGIVLTLGMAVDANVLIFERIREELRNNMSPYASIYRGFEHAFGTILDSNLTTLIVGVILFAIGTGPVKGFAVTLSIGILTSLFTAVTGTRALVELIYGKRQVFKLMVGI